MASILDHLREEHERLRHSVRCLYPIAPGIDPQQQFYQLLCQYTAYARAEERILYSYMLHVQHLRERAVQGLEEHEQLDALFCRAEQTPCGCARWNATIRQLCESMSHHLREEERSLFDLARTALTGQEAAGLGICFVAERTRVYRDLVRVKETSGPPPGALGSRGA